EIENLWLTMSDLEINIAVSMKTIKKMTSEKARQMNGGRKFKVSGCLYCDWWYLGSRSWLTACVHCGYRAGYYTTYIYC
ncbi:MAG: hypothetical protein VZR73_10000, partial [Acutalibacteraceae bacterium]|nr:hypothetical protein [Acutalibacteraceae bacterium]